MIASTTRRPIGKRFMELFRAFPLRPIRDDSEYQAATKVLDKLAIRDEGTLTADEQDYLEALTLFVSSYDDEHNRIDASGQTPGELIRFLLEQQGKSAGNLVPALGSKAAVSLILNGRRVPSRGQCFRLAQYFHVDPGLFLVPPARRKNRERVTLPGRRSM